MLSATACFRRSASARSNFHGDGIEVRSRVPCLRRRSRFRRRTAGCGPASRKLEQLFPGGAADPKLLALLKAPLYPYQADGALFAVRAGRALIGDDMGLGKTIQAIAATEIVARHFGVSKVLVVCPTSLKYQWQSEIMRFSGRQGEKAARGINGGRAQRQKDYALDDFCKITNYEKLRPDLDLIAAWAPNW